MGMPAQASFVTKTAAKMTFCTFYRAPENSLNEELVSVLDKNTAAPPGKWPDGEKWVKTKQVHKQVSVTRSTRRFPGRQLLQVLADVLVL